MIVVLEPASSVEPCHISLVFMSTPLQSVQSKATSTTGSNTSRHNSVYNSLFGKQAFHFTYFSMNFVWNSERSVSLTNPLESPPPRAQFLKTTSSSHLKNKTDNDQTQIGTLNKQGQICLTLLIPRKLAYPFWKIKVKESRR